MVYLNQVKGDGHNKVSTYRRYIMFLVNFNTGAGNFKSDKELDELMNEVLKEVTYTQESIKIENEDGNVVARLPWYGVSADEDDTILVDFGSNGFYGEWILGE